MSAVSLPCRSRASFIYSADAISGGPLGKRFSFVGSSARSLAIHFFRGVPVSTDSAVWPISAANISETGSRRLLGRSRLAPDADVDAHVDAATDDGLVDVDVDLDVDVDVDVDGSKRR